MGGAGAPPFLYDRPQSWNFGAPTSRGFNPRAAYDASWSPKPDKPKSNGPLVDFNKHPDSYLVVPYGNLKAQPMPPNTKQKIVRARSCLLALRWAALLAALGSLFCVIAINKTTTAVAWIIRVSPAVATAHSFYAIYHLSRSINSRTPGSTASYIIFAGLIDLGLLPFCGFAAYMSYLDYSQDMYHWSTLFSDDAISDKIIFAFFILSTTLGGALLLALSLTTWLAIMFRKITRLPPDMNPLEENLTSRFGHKRNKSSTNITAKHMSASTLATNRDSNMSGRRVPFIHTRTDSADSVTLYGTDSARHSRVEMRKGFEEVTKDPYRVSVNSLPGSPLRPDMTHSPSANARSAGAGLDYRPGRVAALASSPTRSPERSPERPSSWLSYMDYEGQPTELSETAEEQLNNEVRPISPVSAISSNPSHGPVTHTWSNRPSFDTQQRGMVTDAKGDLPHAAALMAPPLQPPNLNKRSREPLGMNPPTPVRAEFDMNDENYHGNNTYNLRDPASSPSKPVLVSNDGNSRPSSFIGSGTKGRFYGDLRASIGSIGGDHYHNPEVGIIEGHDDHSDDRLGISGSGVDRSHTIKSAQSASDYSGNFEVYASDDDEEVPTLPPQYQYQQQSPYGSRTSLHPPNNSNHYTPTPPPPQSPTPKPQPRYESPRQTSNSTGLDLHGGYAGLDADFGKGMARRRDVSGKVAEEGRGGIYSWDTKAFEQVNVEEITPKKQHQAAGWARFKGL